MRSGRKSEAQTPSPKKDQIKGSKVNPKGSASSTKSAESIELSDSIINTLENKRDEYNKKHPNAKVTLGALKAVFRRGAGAFSSSHRPNMTRSGWAFARVNKFLLKKGGAKVKAAYVQDDDLMERGAMLDSSCKTYISQNESILKTGYYLNLNEFSTMIDPYGQIPLNLNYTLVTHNSGNQDGLSLIDTINPINLQNELAEILNIPLNNAQVVVGLYIEMGKKFKSISQIEGDNILVIDRDKLVCKSGKDDDLMEKGGIIDEEAQMYIDIISIDPNLPKYAKYKDLLKEKFNIDYDLEYGNNDTKLIDDASLDNLKSKNDFLNYNNYVNYAKKIFRLRGFIENQPNHIEGIVDIDLATEIGKKLGFEIEYKPYNGYGNYAEAISDVIRMPQEVDINTFIHEIGHFFDHQYSKEYAGKAKNSLYATSLYYINKSDEVFAENFMTYFIAPDWLKNNLPEVYYELDQKIPQNYKNTMDDLIDEVSITASKKNIKYEEGGDLGQEIICRGCGWRWNTNQSDASDKYICHRCGFDNRTYYDSDPIGKYHLGGDMSKHLAPNGKPSKLTHEQWHLVRSPEFKAWFGDWENDPANASKVVDGNGEPMVVYHGTTKDFNIFTKNTIGENDYGFFGKGFYFGGISIAKTYSQTSDWDEINDTLNPNGRVLSCFLNVRNPLVDNAKNIIQSKETINDFTLNTIKNFDGVIAIPYQRFSPNTEYVVFEPTQIKLADGTNTKFDAENPDIRYEEGGDLPVGKLAKGMTEEEVAQIHGLHEKDIKNELLLGIEREMEHTDDPKYAKAIALDHLYENPKYYTKLKEMEKSFKEGGYFSDRYPKNEYIQLSNEDIHDFKEDIFNIINSSYAYIGGHIEFQKPDDIVNSDLNFWIGADIDADPEVDTIIGGKKTNFGTKLTASAQDGSRDAKISVMKKMAELLKTKGFYAETNVDLALKRGTEWEKDENIIRKVVGKPDIVMNEDGSYTRSIGGHPHRKVLVGYFDHLKEKNYKRGGELDPDNKGVKDYFAGGSGSTGGVLVGKRHSEGGIKAINKATNTPIEMEGGEVVITRNAVSDNKKREFEGQMLTNKEILSKINVSGGGVSLYEDGGKVGCSFCTGKKYKYGGEMMSDYQIYDEVMRSGGDLALNNRYGSMGYQDANDIDDYNYDEQEIIYHFLRTDADYVYIDKDNVQNIKGLINKGLFNYRETNGNYNVEVYPTKMGKKLLNEMPVEAFKKGGNLPNRKKIIIGTNDSRSKRKKLEDYYASIQEDNQFASGGTIDGLEDLSNCSRSFLVDIKNSGLDYIDYSADRKNEVKELVDNDLIYFTDSSSLGCVTAFLTKKGKQFISSVPTHLFKKGGINDCGCGCGSYKDGGETDDDKKYFKGVSYDYENQFLVNKAIEELLNMKDSNDMTIDEKNFITYYSGYGGLEKYGASGKGLLYEYFTPSLIAKKMWGLAYKHGFEGGFVLEPSCGIGEFIKYAPEQEMVQGYEINETSAKICKILYPKANIKVEPFEKMFIKNNYTIKGQINGMNKYSLVIGNPPYGSMGGLYAGMGEKEYAKANNYIDYFILRGLDLLQSGGLLVFIIGVEVAAGGTPYLEQGITENKKLVSKIADLVDAYRLPNGVFERTDVLTDIVVFKKK